MNLPERFFPPPWTAAVVLLCASACINVPAIESAETEVRMISPTETAYTNGALELRLAVTGHAPDRVELLKNGEVLAELAPPYVYTWDTTGEAEGTYRLEARAVLGDTAFVSPSRDVVVDRTPPQVVSRVPEPGAQEVWVQSPIRAEFSEPMKRSTVTTESVHLRVGELAVAHTVSLSEDGRTVTVTPVTAMTAPSTVELRVEGTLTDLAGNAAVDLGAAWGWVVPEFVPYPPLPASHAGNDQIVQPHIRLDANGHPTVLTYRYYREEASSHTSVNLFVNRWTGSQWEQVGPGLKTSSSDFNINSPNLELLPDGTPIIAWQEDMGAESDNYVHVARWNGTTWYRYGGERGVLPDRPHAYDVSLQLTSQGHPLVAFSMDVEDVEGNTIHAYQWTGEQWRRIGYALHDGRMSPVRAPALAIDSNNNPLVAALTGSSSFQLHAWRWSGTDWEQLDIPPNTGTSLSANSNRQIALTAENQPIAIWTGLETATSTTHIYASQYAQNQWNPLGSPPNHLTTNNREIHAAKFKKEYGLFVLSTELSVQEASVIIHLHSGGAWQKLWSRQFARNLNQHPVGNVSMDIDSSENIAVTWARRGDNGHQEAVIYRRNR